MKIHADFALSLEEKKCEQETRSLVAKFASHSGAVALLTSEDPSTKLLREERMHVVPILCKYSKSPSSLIDKL